MSSIAQLQTQFQLSQNNAHSLLYFPLPDFPRSVASALRSVSLIIATVTNSAHIPPS